MQQPFKRKPQALPLLGTAGPHRARSGSLSWRWPGHVARACPDLCCEVGWNQGASGVLSWKSFCVAGRGGQISAMGCHTGGAWGFDSSWVPGSDLGWRTIKVGVIAPAPLPFTSLTHFQGQDLNSMFTIPWWRNWDGNISSSSWYDRKYDPELLFSDSSLVWCVFVRKEILVKWDLEIILPLIENPFKLDMF